MHVTLFHMWLVSPQNNRSGYVNTLRKAVQKNMRHNRVTSACARVLLGALVWLHHLCTSDALLFPPLSFEANVPEAPLLLPLAPVLQPSAKRLSFPCYRFHMFFVWLPWPQPQMVTYVFTDLHKTFYLWPWHWLFIFSISYQEIRDWAFVGREVENLDLSLNGFRCAPAFNCISYTWVAGL